MMIMVVLLYVGFNKIISSQIINSVIGVYPGTSYYALWKSRQQTLHRLQTIFTKCTVSRPSHSKTVPDTAHAQTAAILDHVTTATKADLNLQKPETEPESGSTDDDVWTSATTSPKAQFPVTSAAVERNSMTSFENVNCFDMRSTGNTQRAASESLMTSYADCRSPNLTDNFSNTVLNVLSALENEVTLVNENGDPVTSFDANERSGNTERAVGEFPVTSFTNEGDPLTLLDNRVSPEINRCSTLTEYDDCAAWESRMTSQTAIGNPVTSFPKDERVPDTPLNGGNKLVDGESPLTSSTNDEDDENPTTSYSNTDMGQASDVKQSTGSSYPETGSDLMKLVLRAENDDKPMIVHRIQIPTVGEVLAEVGIVEQSSTESAGSAATTTDSSMALLHDSGLDISTSRDIVDGDTDQNDQTGGSCDAAKDYSINSATANNASTSENDSGIA